MQTVMIIIGALVFVGALVGFFRSFWQPAPKKVDGGEGAIISEHIPPHYDGGHGGADSGGH